MARIIVANKFYYPRGGDCVYTIDLVKLLEAHGHDVAVFAMQHPDTLSTPWSKYFPSEVQFTKNIKAFDALLRPFGTREVVRKFNALLDDFSPDIVHLNNIHSQLSPVIAELAHKRGVKVFWTLHDYKLLCPRYDCLREGKLVCEACFDAKRYLLKYRCMKNSFAASLLAYGEAVCWNRKRLELCTDRFICPSNFLKEKMLQGGFCKSKLYRLCNFIDSNKCGESQDTREDYYCFVGRLSHEKGIKSLMKAAERNPFKLIVIGSGVLEDELKKKAGTNIEFVGFKQWREIKEIVGKARFSVIASEWYENNPISVIESLCLGTPVLGAHIGGIPELIEEGINGMTFESKNVDDLADKIKMMFEASFDYHSIAENAQKLFDAEVYYQRLMEIYATY